MGANGSHHSLSAEIQANQTHRLLRDYRGTKMTTFKSFGKHTEALKQRGTLQESLYNQDNSSEIFKNISNFILFVS